MLNSIRGTLTYKSEDQVGVDCGGLEWAIDTTSTSISSLPQVGEEVLVYTHLHHTQDLMKLFGFSTFEERRLFLALKTVNGVGVSLARKILSGTTPSRFLRALDSEDLSVLERIPGLGKKTAQKIVLQLRGSLVDADDLEGVVSSQEKEVVDALVAMGFESKAAGKVVSSILRSPELYDLSSNEREKEILRRAIVAMS
ncbi:Holliday junction DNA helicase RuvA [Olavius algarvensis spirochete endosymbiont]|uniref:Holliday junction branch migration protein RuvA n=1 Tax=Olavius algarvensis spirochete endosymbiont TaxID=260710 RepID=UPI000F1F71BE|nr:Holliday junction branch migration protein RuvA [Olavius algarvensis spirochete endosymbiont]VDA99837.1 Holliday junction DNA helicase RuvA [Olavius algarvensis spirochete endosymbiont]